MRFICHGGNVISKNDGQIHYISARKVALLYNIPSHFWATRDVIISKGKGEKYNNKDDIHLYARNDGCYDLVQVLKELNLVLEE